MDAYSTRTVQVHEKERELAQAWERRHGRAPNSRELYYIAQKATLQSRKGKDAGEIDWDALAQRWDATIGGELAGIAPAVSNARGPGAAQRPRRPRARQPGAGRAAVAGGAGAGGAEGAGAGVGEAVRPGPGTTCSSSSRLVMPAADPAHEPRRPRGSCCTTWPTRRCPGGPGTSCRLEAPEWPPLPASLRRELDGRSVYTRPGITRYATAAQLSAGGAAARATRRSRARRGCRANRRRGCSAPTRRCWRRSCASARKTHAQQRHAGRAAAGPGRSRLSTCSPRRGPPRFSSARPGPARPARWPGRRALGRRRPGVRDRHLPERHATAPRGLANTSVSSATTRLRGARAPRIPPGSLILMDEAR